MNSKVALILGAGTSLGSSITKVFADDNFTVVPVRREGEKLKPLEEEINSKGGKCFSFSLDARKEDEVQNFIERVELEIGEIEIAIYNIGANIKYNLTETSSKKYFKVWEMATFGAFLMGREVAKNMIKRKRGTIISVSYTHLTLPTIYSV